MATTKKEIALTPKSLPGKAGELFEMAKILANSGVIPAGYAGRPEAVFAVVQFGREFGIPPMTSLQNMAFINGKPQMGTDLLMALIHRHPEFAGYEIRKLTDEACEVVIRRRYKGQTTPVEFKGSFTMDEARAAGLVRPDSPWVKWRRRMLKHRACSFAARDAFPDILGGTYSDEEMTPEQFAANQDVIMRKLDEVEASFIEGRGPIVEDAPRVEPKAKSSRTSAPTPTEASRTAITKVKKSS